MEKQLQREELEKQYSFSPINRRSKRTYYKSFPPSIIVPDRNMTISVIMSKYAGGQHRGLEPQYCPPDMMDMIQGIDARKLSICELHQRMDENRNNIRNIQKTLQTQEEARKRKEAELAQIRYREQIKAELLRETKETPKTH